MLRVLSLARPFTGARAAAARLAGFAAENTRKPVETKLISQSSGLFSGACACACVKIIWMLPADGPRARAHAHASAADAVAKDIFHGIARGSFAISTGFGAAVSAVLCCFCLCWAQ